MTKIFTNTLASIQKFLYPSHRRNTVTKTRSKATLFFFLRRILYLFDRTFEQITDVYVDLHRKYSNKALSNNGWFCAMMFALAKPTTVQCLL